MLEIMQDGCRKQAIDGIFALSIKNLGSLTKRGSSLQVMAILGGAVLPAIMGRISDATNIRAAFIVPLVCYLYIFYFALNGYRPGNTRREIRTIHWSNGTEIMIRPFCLILEPGASEAAVCVLLLLRRFRDQP
jgi:hypothetical protein